MIKESLKALGDLLLPRRCICCGRTLDTHENWLCIYCKADMPHTYYWDMPHNPMADRLNECIQRHLCENGSPATESKEPYAHAAALFFYKGEYREITKALKYHGNIASGQYFARMLGEKLAGAELYKDVDMIVPVPLHWSRRWQRGYNQAEVLTREIGRFISGAAVIPDLLKRKRSTRTQTKLSIEEKSLNVSRAFEVNPEVMGRHAQPRHVLLVDDVFTTGATLSECHRAIRAAFGPDVKISVATLACVGE